MQINSVDSRTMIENRALLGNINDLSRAYGKNFKDKAIKHFYEKLLNVSSTRDVN